MNRIERMAATLLLLQQRPYTSVDIARQFEISRRTVLRDVQALSEMGVPIIAQEGPGGGYSLPSHYRAGPLPLTLNEAFLLMLALVSLRGMGDLPFSQDLASLQAKLRALVPQDALSGAEGLLEAVRLPDTEPAARSPHLEALISAAREKRWLKVTYRSSRRNSVQYLLPLEIFAENGLWYCRSFSDEHGEERTYRIDRFLSLEPAEESFRPGPAADSLPYGHFTHPRLLVRLSPLGAGWVEREPHLGRLLRRDESGGALLDFRCPPEELDWYCRYFAGLGGEAEVLEPPELRRLLLELGQNLVERYQKR